jgi:hypothetical protein
MPHDRHKQCLDDSIMVDTSNGRSPGSGNFAGGSCGVNS